MSLGLKGISVSDHEALSGHVKANQYALKIKDEHPDFKVMLGNEIYLVDERPSDKHYHFVLTAKDPIGYHQLKELSTIAWLNCYTTRNMTRVDTLKADLERIYSKQPGHLIASSACIGSELGQLILALTEAEQKGNQADAVAAYQRICSFVEWAKNLFKDDFYIEVQPGVSKEQIIVNKRLFKIGKYFNVKLIPTSDAHYLSPLDAEIHKAFLNSEDKEREVDAFYRDAYLHSNEEMIEKFALSGFDEDTVNEFFDNSMEIYDKVQNFSLAHSQQVPKVDVPNIPKAAAPFDLANYPVLSKMYSSDDPIDRYWVNTCVDKLKKINKYNKEYLDELEDEADIKRVVGERLDTNMYAYPVCLSHYIDLIWDCGSTIGVGRGSACSALNHYLLGITQLDPLTHEFPFFRYMNRDTDGLGDIDIDVCPSKVQDIVAKIREERGQKFNADITDPLIRKSLGATYVCTFGSESSKSAVQTACRGYRSEQYPDGIDVDVAQYLSSLIPSERGFVWPISDVVFGNEEKDRKPCTPFINEVDQYPGLLDIILGIEGCISRRGRHASGVLFMGEDPFEFTAFMKTPSGEVVTQFDLHDAEWAGAVKMDILVTEIQDKIVQTIKLLQEDNVIDPSLSIRSAYEQYLHPDVLPMNDPDTWDVIQRAASLDLFQLDSDIGRQGAKKIKPENIWEMSSVNGLIRLMTAEKGQETWLDKYVRYKNVKGSYEKDISKYNLTPEEIKTFSKYVGTTLGIGISQEQFMKSVMDTGICGFSLKEANKARKVISKKKMNEIPLLKEQIFSKAVNPQVANYVWDYIVAPGLGYSFSDIHSMSYSYIGFQSAYLATKWPSIYWNTACLIVNSGALENESDEDDEESDNKDKSTNYGKVASAIGSMMKQGIKISLLDINESSLKFKPKASTNEILFGFKGAANINNDTVDKIISGRPYISLKDFMKRCPLTKTIMFSLIKGGAFDNTETWAKSFKEPRKAIMAYYVSVVCEPKNKITLSNFNGLLQRQLVPSSLASSIQAFADNVALKNSKYIVSDSIMERYPALAEISDYLNGAYRVNQAAWKKIYDSKMDEARDWIKNNQALILKELNTSLFKECWEKYASGTISSWEMEALCFYYHEHELSPVNNNKYGIVDFYSLNSVSDIDSYFKIKGKDVPKYKIYKIAGTVISKNDTRSSINLLTPTGVVSVKFTKEYYAMYNRQLSKKGEDGVKHVVEKGWFKRGTKIMCVGYRREDTFVCKTYKDTNSHQLYKIIEIEDDGSIILTHERAEE